MKAIVAALGLIAFLSACGPQSTSSVHSDADAGLVNADPVTNSSRLVRSVVSIQSLTASGSKHRCTGVFIHRQVVLTAAHCLFDKVNGQMVQRDASRMGLAFGANVQKPQTILPIAATRAHRAYDPSSALCQREDYSVTPPASCKKIGPGVSQDIGLVFLDQPAPQFVEPIADMSRAENGTAFKALLVGYGFKRDPFYLKTPAERDAHLGLLHSYGTFVRFSQQGLGAEPSGFKYTDQTFGIQFENDFYLPGNKGRMGMTGGDSGGPIFSVDESGRINDLVGIFTATGPIQVGYPNKFSYEVALYVRVKSHLRWIQDEMEGFRARRR